MPVLQGSGLAPCWDPPRPLLSAHPEVPSIPAAPSPFRAAPAPLSCSPCLPPSRSSSIPAAAACPASYCPPAMASCHRVCTSLGSSRAQPKRQGPALMAWGHPPAPTPGRFGQGSFPLGGRSQPSLCPAAQLWHLATREVAFWPASHAPDQQRGASRPVPSWSDRVPGNRGLTFQELRFKTAFFLWSSYIPWGFSAFSSPGITYYLWSLFKNYDYLNLKKK